MSFLADSIYAGLSDVGDDALADRSEIQDEIGTDDMNSDSEKVVQVLWDLFMDLIVCVVFCLI